jgi:hypothetical protein
MQRPLKVAYGRAFQRAVLALPQLPTVFTPKQLQRLMPERSVNQCRRLMQALVARGYCARATKHGVTPVHTTPLTTTSDRVLAMLQDTPVLTRQNVAQVLGVHHQSAYRLLERMAALGQLSRRKVETLSVPHWRVEYSRAVAPAPVHFDVPQGCTDPACACPISQSDYDVRQGRLVRVVCRRHDRQDAACSR